MSRPCRNKIQWSLTHPRNQILHSDCFGAEKKQDSGGWSCEYSDYHAGGVKFAGNPNNEKCNEKCDSSSSSDSSSSDSSHSE